MKTKDCLAESQLDVLKTIPDAVSVLGGFAEYEKYLHNGTVTESQLITSSTIIRKAWKDESVISSYVILGLAKYLRLLDDDCLSWTANCTGRDDGSCDIFPKFKKYAQDKKIPMTTLVKNRLSNMGVETIAFRIAAKVIGVTDNKEQIELCQKLGFDNEGQTILTTSEKLKAA